MVSVLQYVSLTKKVHALSCKDCHTSHRACDTLSKKTLPTMSPVLSVSYTLQPPTSTNAPSKLSMTTTHEFSVQLKSSEAGSEAGTQDLPAYYAALRDAIAQAKDVTGSELTKWRDAVGDGEKNKTGGKAEVNEEGEGEDFEGEEA